MGNSPANAVDSTGLSYVTAQAKADQKDATAFVEKLIADVINEASNKPGASPATIKEAIVRNLLSDERHIVARLDAAVAEKKIEAVLSKPPESALKAAGKFKNLVPDGANVLKIDGKSIGTDKFDHFLEMGLNYYEVKHTQNMGEDYAIGMGYWLEGIVPPKMDAKMYDWLSGTHEVYFMGLRIEKDGASTYGRFGDWFQVLTGKIGWGGPEWKYVLLDEKGSASPADLAANEAGLRFWEDLMSAKPGKFKFDLKKYVQMGDWDQSTNPNVEGAEPGVRPRKPWR